MEVREKRRVSREFLDLAKGLIAATPMYPARNLAGPTDGFFDVVIETQSPSLSPEPLPETRPARKAEGN